MEKVLDNEYATVVVYPEKKIVHHQFHKFIFGDHLREVLLAGEDAFVKHGCNKWLSDDRGNTSVKPDDFEWSKKNWESRLLKAGWKHWALIPPQKAIGQLSMKKVIEHFTSQGVNVTTFTNPEEAMAWLEKQ